MNGGDGLYNWQYYAKFGFRVIELLSLGFLVSGSLWASNDLLLLYVIVKTPVAPLSLLFILYGLFGTIISEVGARIVNKKADGTKKSLEEASPSISS